MSRIALPEMRLAKYDDGLAAGAIAAGGSIGILVPPSIILVIYGAIAEQSVPKLFAAALNATFIHRQTLAGQVRFTTAELGETEDAEAPEPVGETEGDEGESSAEGDEG